MTQRVLILGGSGRIGSSVAEDIAKHTQAEITVTGRRTVEKQETPFKYLALDLAETDKLQEAISNTDVVVHCAGPFHYRDTTVLQFCIEQDVNYVDVSDHRSYTSKVLTLDEQAREKGITAVINTGIFPGISNSMVRQCVEQFDEPETIHLSYVVSGSGGAGITVMRTTFLGLQNPFEAWINGNWKTVKPYTDRENVSFPQPYGNNGVYWFDMPETFTLPKAFPTVKNVITKFGSVPDFYNHLTWIAANVFPKSWIQNSGGVEFLSQVSHFMTDVTDNFSGIGVAIRSEVMGIKDGQSKKYCSTLAHDNTAVAAGYGAGTIVQLLLEGKLHKPGVFPVEEALSTDLFQETMTNRAVTINQQWL
ncbi:MAG: saccharopine dehydrogenase NADP-binding domain-containing protein [Rivularia sp. ALOHA_DT_140]|nr:saccharopine dehydrogenase NADP-binding domain-containing protein [Rivularia sp. ALOHA_DT_140]